MTAQNRQKLNVKLFFFKWTDLFFTSHDIRTSFSRIDCSWYSTNKDMKYVKIVITWLISIRCTFLGIELVFILTDFNWSMLIFVPCYVTLLESSQNFRTILQSRWSSFSCSIQTLNFVQGNVGTLEEKLFCHKVKFKV